MKILGWSGTLFLGTASLPQLYKVLSEGHANGMAWGYVLLLWAGFLAMSLFTWISKAAVQLRISYSLQCLIFTVILVVKAIS